MTDGFIKIACATPDVKVADCRYNADRILALIQEAHSKGVKLLCFPELSVTGYTCGDLFLQEALLRAAKAELVRIIRETEALDIVSIIGMPLAVCGKLYNCAVVVNKGKAVGAVAKKNIPNYSEFYEARHFAPAPEGLCAEVPLGEGYSVHLEDTVFTCEELPELTFGVEICEDLWVSAPPSEQLAGAGAVLLFNLSASDEVIGKAEYRRTLIKARSGSLACAYAYADAGIGESTQDMVFAGHNIIAENGSVLAESKAFSSGLTIADIDIQKLTHERRRMNTFNAAPSMHTADVSLAVTETPLFRCFPRTPFVPTDKQALDSRCEEILTMQAVGLMTRLRHIGCKTAVLGLSGGLDSTLALIVTVHAFDMLGLDRSGIHAITMPCFGTISQKTEDIVGPYELHDFFLYYMLRCGFAPSKIYRIACIAFAGAYPEEVILKWLKTFVRRFFSQQFKRSCLPDGSKVGTVTLSPRGDWRMPSDASASVWLREIDSIGGGCYQTDIQFKKQRSFAP